MPGVGRKSDPKALTERLRALETEHRDAHEGRRRKVVPSPGKHPVSADGGAS